MAHFLKNVLSRFQIEPLQSGAVMKFDADEKPTYEDLSEQSMSAFAIVHSWST
jgi:hypothetical protein